MTTFEYDQEKDKFYEVDERGQKELVRSKESTSRIHLRFRNKTRRVIDLWWRDYCGYKRHYIRIKPGNYFDINTFTTHPWEFTDAATGERYVIDNKPIFRPPLVLGGMDYRTNWNITISVRTLKKTSMLAINDHLRDVNAINALEIPRALAEELQVTVMELRKPLTPVRRQ